MDRSFPKNRIVVVHFFAHDSQKLLQRHMCFHVVSSAIIAAAIQQIATPNIYVNRTLRRHKFQVHLQSFRGARPVTLALDAFFAAIASLTANQIAEP